MLKHKRKRVGNKAKQSTYELWDNSSVTYVELFPEEESTGDKKYVEI